MEIREQLAAIRPSLIKSDRLFITHTLIGERFVLKANLAHHKNSSEYEKRQIVLGQTADSKHVQDCGSCGVSMLSASQQSRTKVGVPCWPLNRAEETKPKEVLLQEMLCWETIYLVGILAHIN